MAKKLDYQISSKIRKYLGKQTQTKTITEISRNLDIGRNTVAKYLELLKKNVNSLLVKLNEGPTVFSPLP